MGSKAPAAIALGTALGIGAAAAAALAVVLLNGNKEGRCVKEKILAVKLQTTHPASSDPQVTAMSDCVCLHAQQGPIFDKAAVGRCSGQHRKGGGLSCYLGTDTVGGEYTIGALCAHIQELQVVM